MEDARFFLTVAAALVAAVVGGIIATRLRQSPIVGFIVGGVVIGPYTPGFVGDIGVVTELANIGVALLMFSVGIDVSLKQLREVGAVAIVGGTLQVVATVAIGAGVGVLLGFSPIAAFCVGAVAAVSSSIILGRVLEESGELGSTHGRIAFGWSAVQDFAAIVLIVLLNAAAAERTDAPILEIALNLGKATIFLVLLIPTGSVVLPRVFERVASLRNREVFALTVAMVALGMAYLATLVGLSLALGAFVAGIVISESDLSYQILGEVTPLRDIFAGFFFVSVGMLLNPLAMIENWALALATLALIVVIKGVVSAGIARLFRYSWRVAIFVGAGLAQSAEFSFLIARVGADLGVLSESQFAVLLLGSVGSILLAPSVYRAAIPFTSWWERQQATRGALAPTEPSDLPRRNHAIICGYGRVGRVVGQTLRRRGLTYVVIDQDQQLVRQLRQGGVTAWVGNPDIPRILDAAGIATARVLVLAIPNARVSRLAVAYARQVNPRLNIIVRAHSLTERDYLLSKGVDEVVVGELELAFELTRYTLQRFGVSAQETRVIIQRLRMDAEGGDE